MSDQNLNYGTPPEEYKNPEESNLFPDRPVLKYAGFGVRFVAYLIDAILLFGLNYVVGMLMGSDETVQMEGFDPEAFGFATVFSMEYWISALVGLLYFVLMESGASQGTLGKIVMGLKVTDTAGSRISPLNALGRYLAKILSGLILGIGYLMIIWDSRKQGLHDQLAKTFVLRK